MKKTLHLLYYLSSLLIVFPFFVMSIIPGTNGNITYGFIFAAALYVICALIKPRALTKTFVKIFRLPITKYYLYFIGFIIFTTFVNIISGNYTAPSGFYIVRIYKVFYAFCLIYYLPILSVFLGIKKTIVIKILFSIIYFVLFAGFIQYLGSLLHTHFISYIYNFFSNGRETLYFDTSFYTDRYRVYSFFGEPSTLAQFIYITMPFVVFLSLSKYKIYKNVIVNRFIKITIMPLMLVVLVFTKSPIYLILCIFEYIILIFLFHYDFLKRHLFKILFVVFITFITIYVLLNSIESINIETTYLKRIINTIKSIRDFETFIKVEPSLASRIVSYSAQLAAFPKKMFIGCGLYNAEIYINSFFLQIVPLPLTIENYTCHLSIPYWTGLNRSIVYTSLFEFGLIGFYLYLLFVYKIIKHALFLQKSYVSIDNIILKSTFWSIIAICILSFYNLHIENAFVWIVYGMLLMYEYDYFYNRRKIYE